ncbi:MAG: peroxidase [Anaerolineae bacterium]|nr:peroxidase [Anaerolineae bacterium]
MTKNYEWVEQLKEDYTKADLDTANRAMLDYTAKLTRTPGEITQADIASLRQVGFNDRAILDIAQITAYYAYANRLVDGLGVSLESYWSDGKEDYE